MLKDRILNWQGHVLSQQKSPQQYNPPPNDTIGRSSLAIETFRHYLKFSNRLMEPAPQHCQRHLFYTNSIGRREHNIFMHKLDLDDSNCDARWFAV